MGYTSAMVSTSIPLSFKMALISSVSARIDTIGKKTDELHRRLYFNRNLKHLSRHIISFGGKKEREGNPLIEEI